MDFTLHDLERFIVAAKAACYVGSGAKVPPSRPGAMDLTYAAPGWSYRDSYFGGTDFIGQEAVWRGTEVTGTPVWVMNYHGRILRDDLIDGARAAEVIRAALSGLYREDRFLGGFTFTHDDCTYTDCSDGTVAAFTGTEEIAVRGTLAYRLVYHGGTVRP
jgi:Domain of unknown function (DUF5680)